MLLRLLDPARTALVVIDVQRAFDEWEASGMRRNNPGALAAITALLDAFRTVRASIFHIRHQSNRSGSSFASDAPGYQVREEARERPGEPVIVKHVNSAFIGTDLEQRLPSAGLDTVVICGATTNHCVETTTRMAGNLGFIAVLASDATWTFDRTGPDGRVHAAADIQSMTEANLTGEFAEVAQTADVIRRLNYPCG